MNPRLRAALTLVAAITLGALVAASTGSPLFGFVAASAVAFVHSPLAQRLSLGAAGDPIKLGALASNGVFLMAAETGIIIDSFRRKESSKKLEFYDGSAGKTTGLVYHDFVADYTIKGAVNGSTGIMAAAIGVALTISNTDTGPSVTAGGIYVDDFEIGHEAQQLREVTVNGSQRNAIS